MQLGLTEPLSTLVSRRFNTAKEAGHLIFSSTHLSVITTAGIPYQLRYCPALQKKPTNPTTSATGPKPPKPDPFKDPSPDLLIATFPPDSATHALVLNKFPVIPNHFILATREWKPQTDLLEPVDLGATYACLEAWSEDAEHGHNGNGDGDGVLNGNGGKEGGVGGEKRLFAFFNSGEESGASQPHRHLQFLPVEAMRAGSEGWEPLIDLVETSSKSQSSSTQGSFQYVPNLPFKHFALPIPPNPTPESLHEIYLALYHAAVNSTKQKTPSPSARTTTTTEGTNGGAAPTSGPAFISYNLALTLHTMLLCPRKSETAVVPVDARTAGDVVDGGVVSVNGTILAGTLMVKAEAEWDVLRSEKGVLGRVLGDIGFGNERGEGGVGVGVQRENSL